MKILMFMAALAMFPAAASAHVDFLPGTGQAGGKYVGALRVSHGCKGAATTSLRVELPAGVTGAKPQAKPGWDIVVERDGDTARAITWTGRLPDDEFDDFTVMLSLPNDAGTLYFPTVQTCDGARVDWRTIPAAGQGWHDVETPAPVLNVSPANGAMDGHHH